MSPVLPREPRLASELQNQTEGTRNSAVKTCLRTVPVGPEASTIVCVREKQVCPGSKNPESCLSNAEWVLNCECSQESRMMWIQQADVLQCFSWRFNAYESLSQILLLSRRAKKQLFSYFFFYYVMLFVMLHFYVIEHTFPGHVIPSVTHFSNMHS